MAPIHLRAHGIPPMLCLLGIPSWISTSPSSLLPFPVSSLTSGSDQDSGHLWIPVWIGGRHREHTCGRWCFLASPTKMCWLSSKMRGCCRWASTVAISWAGLRSPRMVTSKSSRPTWCLTGFWSSLFPSLSNPLLAEEGTSGSLRLRVLMTEHNNCVCVSCHLYILINHIICNYVCVYVCVLSFLWLENWNCVV